MYVIHSMDHKQATPIPYSSSTSVVLSCWDLAAQSRPKLSRTDVPWPILLMRIKLEEPVPAKRCEVRGRWNVIRASRSLQLSMHDNQSLPIQRPSNFPSTSVISPASRLSPLSGGNLDAAKLCTILAGGMLSAPGKRTGEFKPWR